MKKDTQEFKLGTVFREYDLETLYWLKEGKVMYRGYLVRGADVESFRFYVGAFAKDRNHCYCTNSRLAGGNAATFRALNYTYATDGRFVWALGGKLKEADAESFVVCDEGSYDLGGPGGRVPHGYGKDKNRVFFYNFDGKPNWVRKGSPDSFVSLNDGHFGKDANFVFCGAVTLPKANVLQWRKIGGFYSKDDVRVYYFNRQMRDADYSSFEVAPTGREWMQLAKDKNHYYHNDQVIDAAYFEAMLAQYRDPAK